MPTLDMRRTAVEARQDLAFAMRERGLSHAEIAAVCGWSPNSDGIRRAILAGAERAKTNRGRTSTRGIGVEIEFLGTPRRRAVDAINELDNRIQVEIEGWNHRVQDYWKFITDGSVDGTGTGEGGLEAVSPILYGEKGLAELKMVLEGIRNAGGRVNRSCGLHVHHDARDMSAAQVAYLLEMYCENQTTIDQMLAPSRRSTNRNRWCQPWSHDKEHMIQTAKDGRSLENFDRYRTINVTSYPKYGSIEFRQHQGTLNHRKIVAWVKFGQAMMEHAKTIDNTTSTPPKFETVKEMTQFLITGGKLPAEVADYLTHRAEDYAAE